MINLKKIKEIFSATGIGASRFGLDMGTFGIKAVEIKKGWSKEKNSFSFGVAEMTQEQADKAAIIEAIKQSVEEGRISSKWANISLSGSDIITRYILMPKLQERELVTALEFELSKHIPHKLEDMVIDYQITDKSIDSEMLVLVVGVERRVIAEKIDLVKQAGLQVASVNVDCFAIIDAFCHAGFPPAVGGGSVSLLDLGHRVSKLAVLENNVVRFSRDILLGSFDLTKAISERMNLDLHAAEKLKCSSDDSSEELEMIIKSNLNNILDEVRISFDYCERFIQQKISKLYLCGGGARLKNIDKFLNSALDMEIDFWDPLTNQKLGSSTAKEDLEINKSSVLTVAAGLALS
ncbi:MAG TPA: type IV pilus assembly protein PilM [Candidatus Omnitrophica bacterium]|nr:type IV pilus assembly protein PilM [Candidatus Omnitrophota bacterium]